jgi:exopolyphosphatase/guanosine-5'-triphosphate,3'-diphosphate pyrophosphatase
MSYVEMSETFAALDLGTTNCRLLIARPGRDGLHIVDSFSRIVRLGEGLDASGSLSEIAMRRTVEALSICATKVSNRQVTRSRFVATEACRRAANCEEFVGRVRQATGLDLEIIPTGEEARLALAGCAPLLDAQRAHAVVFDIGGGSTELLWVGVTPRHGGAATEIRGVVSLPFGVVSLTERFRDRPTGRAVYQDMVATARDTFAEFDRHWDISRLVASGTVQMLGSSGTVTTLAGMQMGLPRYERSRVDGKMLRFGDIARITASLVEMTPAERATQPCIGQSRADLMIAGCAILEAICGVWPVGRLRVADRGVREGILVGLWENSRRRRSRRQGGDRAGGSSVSAHQ